MLFDATGSIHLSGSLKKVLVLKEEINKSQEFG